MGLTVAELALVIQKEEVAGALVQEWREYVFELLQPAEGKPQRLLEIDVGAVVEKGILDVSNSSPAHGLAGAPDLEDSEHCDISQNVHGRTCGCTLDCKVFDLFGHQCPDSCLRAGTR